MMSSFCEWRKVATIRPTRRLSSSSCSSRPVIGIPTPHTSVTNNGLAAQQEEPTNQPPPPRNYLEADSILCSFLPPTAWRLPPHSILPPTAWIGGCLLVVQHLTSNSLDWRPPPYCAASQHLTSNSLAAASALCSTLSLIAWRVSLPFATPYL